MSIGGNIKKMRTERKLTQEQLAQEIGVTRPFVTQLERGTKILTVPLAKQIAAVFECTVDDLAKE